MSRFSDQFPDLGIGVGLRSKHFPYILTQWPKVDWFELLTENYMDTGGRPLHVADQIAERYPVVLHGVSLSIGATDPLDFDYLRQLKALKQRLRARFLTDHLCWTGTSGKNLHDLLPMPYTEQSLRHVVARVKTVQDFLECRIALENPSSYLEFAASTLDEAEFLARIAVDADCGILLDVNNVYVSSVNHGFDAARYVRTIPADRVVQFHLAGHTDKGTHLLDTHSAPVIPPVWKLYALAHERTGARSTLLEWDEDIPDFVRVHREARKAEKYRRALATA